MTDQTKLIQLIQNKKLDLLEACILLKIKLTDEKRMSVIAGCIEAGYVDEVDLFDYKIANLHLFFPAEMLKRMQIVCTDIVKEIGGRKQFDEYLDFQNAVLFEIEILKLNAQEAECVEFLILYS